MSYKRGHRRASRVRVVIARMQYRTADAEGNADVITTPMPDERLPRAVDGGARDMENVARDCRCSGSRARSRAKAYPSTVGRSHA